MAVRYVRSTDGSDADNGTTWALAKATITGVAAIDTAGDTLWVSQAHGESGATLAFALAGTPASPTKLLCGNDAAEPPTALATTAVVTASGTITIQGSVYAYGIDFRSATGILLGTNAACFQKYDTCVLSTSTSSYVQAGPTNVANVGTRIEFNNCTFKYGSVGGGLLPSGLVFVNGGSILSGGTNITSFVVAGIDRTHCECLISGFDLSNMAAGLHLVTADALGSRHVVFRNCKLPASWSGSLVNGTIQPGQRYEMHNCDAGNTNYRSWVEDYAGSTKSETTIVRTSGASDGTTPISWKMVSSANTSFPTVRLESVEIPFWNDTTGSSKTLTVEIVHDTNVAGGQGAGTASAFQDDEIWLEVQYLGDASFPVSTFISDAKASVLATAADQASSSVTWTTTGLTTPVKQALSVTFTPQKKGPYMAKVVIAKASKTIYVDPLITVT